MPGEILTSDQQTLVKKELEKANWRNDADISRRRHVGLSIRQILNDSGVLDGKTIDRRRLCELISLQWQIQNLNPIWMPAFLGSYEYKKYFAAYSGTREDLVAQLEEKTGDKELHPGADLVKVSDALRKIASKKVGDQVQGAAALFSLKGAGPAIVSGFLSLLHPQDYGIVNSPTMAPFVKEGWLNVTEQQRRAALETAKSKYSHSGETDDGVLDELFRWQIFLSEVKTLCELTDFHELDKFLWTVTTTPPHDAEDKLLAAVNDIRTEDLNTRIEAEQKGRELIDGHLGGLSTEQFRELFTLLNTCVGKKSVVYTRFSPAFVGHNANQLIDHRTQLNEWIRRLWIAEEDAIPGLLNTFWEEDLAGTGRSFPTAILYLRNKVKYAVWTAALEKALYSVIPGLPARIKTGFSYLQYCKDVHALRESLGFAPEMHDFVLFRVIRQNAEEEVQPKSGQFSGFTIDAFEFMKELVQHNSTQWFVDNRNRFKDSVDRPLRRLVSDLGSNVITPLAPELEVSPQSGKCLSRIRKNIWGKAEQGAYNKVFWAAFYRRDYKKHDDCQLFLAIWPDWFEHGLFFGENANAVLEKLKETVDQYPDLSTKVFNRLKNSGFSFRQEGKDPDDANRVDTYESFVKLVHAGRFHVYRRTSPEDAAAAGATFSEEVGEDLRKLYPLFKLATSSSPDTDVPPLLNESEEEDEDDISDEDKITIADLAANTYLEEEFFESLDFYLQDKQQLIFCGPPGTGKTFVALKYAEYLIQAGGRLEKIQFHPSYAYEDFIEGLRPSTSKSGQLTYTVESGIFKRLCDAARASPKAKHVLLIDEINRGNIPRIFGELLFLLEHRDNETTLPYSKSAFSIPQNVIVLGTMNSSDRSIALFDLALRRRFHFVEMQPRVEVLLGWLEATEKPKYIRDVFLRLNDALKKVGIDDDRLVGHAHFMSPLLNEEYLALIWKGTIEPLLREYFFATPDKMAEFQVEKFLALIDEAEAAQPGNKGEMASGQATETEDAYG